MTTRTASITNDNRPRPLTPRRPRPLALRSAEQQGPSAEADGNEWQIRYKSVTPPSIVFSLSLSLSLSTRVLCWNYDDFISSVCVCVFCSFLSEGCGHGLTRNKNEGGGGGDENKTINSRRRNNSGPVIFSFFWGFFRLGFGWVVVVVVVVVVSFGRLLLLLCLFFFAGACFLPCCLTHTHTHT